MKSFSKFQRRNNVWIILFFKADEKESTRYKDMWTELASKLYGVITVAGVNCNQNDMICDDFEAYGWPAIYIAKANIESDYIKYTGSYELKKIASAGIRQMENFAQIVTQDNYDRFISE